MAVSEWLQPFNSVRGPIERLGIKDECLTEFPHAALRTGNAHQDVKKSEEIC